MKIKIVKGLRLWIPNRGGNGSGFTLIELLVAMGIIAVLTAMAVFNFNLSRIRARDVQRKSDVDQLQKALEVYKLDNGTYPTGNLQDTLLGLPSKQIQYIKKYFNDPKGPTDWVDYIYKPSANFKNYYLMTCLENSGDSAKETDSAICQQFTTETVDPCRCGHYNARELRTGTMYIVSQP